MMLSSMSKTSRRKAPAHVEGCIAARAFRRRIVRLFDAIDLLLCPAWPFPASHPRGDERDIAMQGVDGGNPLYAERFTCLWNLAATPPSRCRGASMRRGSHSPFSSSSGRSRRGAALDRGAPRGRGPQARDATAAPVRSRTYAAVCNQEKENASASPEL